MMTWLDKSTGRTTKLALAGLLLAVVAAVGCDGRYSPWYDNSDRYNDDDDDWWEDDPCQGTTSSGTGGSGYDPGVDGPGDDAARAIAEADIVRIVGQTLYALSRTHGLSVIDLSGANLSLVGQRELTGTPAEMYVVDTRIYALTDYPTSHQTGITVVEALNPTNLYVVGSQHVQGHLSDSRMIGEVIYLVTSEDHECNGCPDEPTTLISSLAVGGSSNPELLDQLTYTQPDLGQSFKRSVTATTDRLYVAGIEWDGVSTQGHSTIQVVDITDPGGMLEEGAVVEAAGQILNRWQMDERDGVLRVISQPGVWSNDEVPVVQTFTIESSQVVTPLGSLAIELPVPESLRAVRFDGNRAYAITAQAPEPYDPTPGSEMEPPPPPQDSCGPGCDPLFVIDLTNPAQPVQMGSLEMPGWVFHMEPRGDRLMALGFDSTYPLGQLSVSMFDVADGNHPTLIDRVTFGGQWTGLAEDQSRIHKAFTIIDEAQRILVPYGWWEAETWTECWDDPCWGTECWTVSGEWEQRGAVKVIAFSSSALQDRGDAPLESWALRALVHDDDLLAVSDEEVRRFDITGTPSLIDQLWL